MKPTRRKFSKITIYKGVPFDPTYKHVVDWTSKDVLDAYLNEYEHITMEDSSYQNIMRTIRWDSKLCSYNELLDYTYVRIENTDTINDKKNVFYAFISSVMYVNDGVSQIFFHLDVWNTYKYVVGFNKAEIKRGFVKELKDDYSDWTDKFNEIRHNDEPVGGDGANRLQCSNYVRFNKVVDTDETYVTDNAVRFILFTLQPKDIKSDGGSYVGDYSQYHYRFIPYNVDSHKTLKVTKEDGNVIYEGGKDIDDIFKGISDNEDFAGSASLVVDCEVYNYIGIRFECKLSDRVVTEIVIKQKGLNLKGDDLTIEVKNLRRSYPQTGICMIDDTEDKPFSAGNNMFKTFDNYLKYILEYDKSSYKDTIGKNIPYKILGAPWNKLYFTDGRGTTGCFDLMKYNHLKMKSLELKRFSGIQTNGKQVYALNNYDRAKMGDDDASEMKVYENAMMVDNSPRDVPVLLDNYTMYLNANKNQLQATRKNAEMTMQLAKSGNSMQLGQTNRGISASNTILSNDLNTQSATLAQQSEFDKSTANLNTGGQVLSGAIGGLGAGAAMGPKGAIGGMALGAATGLGSGLLNKELTNRSIENNEQLLSISQSTARANQKINNQLTKANALENYAYANQIATNNYEATIRSQNAMLADVANHNDVVAHQGTGALFDTQNQNTQLSWQMFSCHKSVLMNVCLFFNLFGYTINKFEPIDNYLFVKDTFNYVQTANANVLGNLNRTILNQFNAILNNGVTVWNEYKMADFETKNIVNNDFR